MIISCILNFISGVICALLCIDLCWGELKLFPKCYCPGTDQALASTQFSEVRDLMYVKRREYTNSASGFPPIHYFPGKANSM